MSHPGAPRRFDWKQLLRYYQAGIANTLFGYGCYALLVALKVDMFAAQLISHVLGTLFNYLTYSRYAFAKESRSIVRFIASYGVNYLLSVAALYGLSQIVSSPYLSGLLAICVVSVINFVILKRFVFRSVKSAN